MLHVAPLSAGGEHSSCALGELVVERGRTGRVGRWRSFVVLAEGRVERKAAGFFPLRRKAPHTVDALVHQDATVHTVKKNL